MGKGFHNYMSKKFFHPGSFDNIKRKWMAEQKAAHDKKKEEDTLAQYQKEQEMYQNRALLGDEKAKLGLNFMYDPPPGVKRDREKEEDEPEYKFEWQRKYNAPRESYAKGDETVRDQPFGIEVRNVRCLKCRQWGHINTDKVCPLYGKSITADLPQLGGSNPGELMDQMQEEGLAFTKKVMSRQNDPAAANQQLVDSEAEEDEEIAFFLSLSRKEKKKLVKQLEKRRKKEKKARKKRKEFDDMEEITKESREGGDNSDKSKKGNRENRGDDRRHRGSSPCDDRRGQDRNHTSERNQWSLRSPSRGNSNRSQSPRDKASNRRRSRSPIKSEQIKRRAQSSERNERTRNSSKREKLSRSPEPHRSHRLRSPASRKHNSSGSRDGSVPRSPQRRRRSRSRDRRR